MGKQSALKMNLPADLAAFLKAGRQLEYDPAACEAGEITLLSLSELKLERFPVETSGLDNFEDDPHYPEVNSYLVPGVNLVAECDEYEPAGLLLWLPVENGTASGTATIAAFGYSALKPPGRPSPPTRFHILKPDGRT